MDSKEDDKSPMYSVTRFEKGQDELPGEDEEMSQVDEEIVEMELDRAVKYIATHINTAMYCLNCSTIITTVSTCEEEIVRPETPEVSKCFSFFSLFVTSGTFHDKTEDMDSKLKNSTKQNIEEVEKSPTRSVTTLQKEQEEMLGEDEEIVELEFERAVNRIDTDDNTIIYCVSCGTRITTVLICNKSVIEPPPSDDFGCVSCLSVFIPSGYGFDSFRIFGAREDNYAEESLQCASEEYEELHRDVLIRTLGGKGKIKPN